MGGKIALQLAAGHPELVDHLVLAATAARPAVTRRFSRRWLMMDVVSRIPLLRKADGQPSYAFEAARAGSTGPSGPRPATTAPSAGPGAAAVVASITATSGFGAQRQIRQPPCHKLHQPLRPRQCWHAPVALARRRRRTCRPPPATRNQRPWPLQTQSMSYVLAEKPLFLTAYRAISTVAGVGGRARARARTPRFQGDRRACAQRRCCSRS